MASIYAKGRDNARTPMQWEAGENAGFTTGTPWIRVNPNFREINAAGQRKDPDSVFSYYQRLIGLRKEFEILVEGDFELLCEEDPDVFAYVRRWNGQKLLVAANFHGNTAAFEIPEEFRENGVRLIGNYEGTAPERLRPYEAVMVLG